MPTKAFVEHSRACGKSFRSALAARGYFVPYQTGRRCPGCGMGHWWIGGQTAECAKCGTALALPLAIRRGGSIFTTKSRTA